MVVCRSRNCIAALGAELDHALHRQRGGTGHRVAQAEAQAGWKEMLAWFKAHGVA